MLFKKPAPEAITDKNRRRIDEIQFIPKDQTQPKFSCKNGFGKEKPNNDNRNVLIKKISKNESKLLLKELLQTDLTGKEIKNTSFYTDQPKIKLMNKNIDLSNSLNNEEVSDSLRPTSIRQNDKTDTHNNLDHNLFKN